MNGRDSVWLDMSPTELEDAKNQHLYNYQLIRHFSNNCDQKNIKKIKKLMSSYSQLADIIGIIDNNILCKPEFKHKTLDKLFEKIYNDCQSDNNELLFFASAIFDLTKLQEVIRQLKRDGASLNQTRFSDSVIIFLLKYANLKHENFLNCLTILVEAGVDVNLFDIRGKTAIDYVATLYDGYKDDQNISTKIKEMARLFLNAVIIRPENDHTNNFLKEMDFNDETYNYKEASQENKLFYYLIKNKTKELLAFENIEIIINVNTNENTFLQLACKKSDNMLPIVEFFLKNGADPNLTTDYNPYTPLELAAKNNYQKIFEELLKHEKTNITEQHYTNFVKWRSRPMKVKLFEMFLESNKLDPTFSYEKTKNTPLHYAVIFSHKKAIQNLLKRQSSLIVKNKCDISVLDIIDAEDLETYFDTCLALDNYSPYFSDINYKMKFKFNCLVDSEASREIKVVSKIGNHQNLEHLLMHPFVHTFLSLKWFRIKIYYWFVLLFQAFLFLFLSVCFYHLPNSSILFSICIFFSVINFVIKTPIFLFFKIKNNRPKFFALNRATLHGFLELFLIITIIGSFIQNQFRAFVFVEMAIAFLLTAGYHPKLSKWSLMLQQVFKTFTILLIFFSLIVVAFSIGFSILFPDDYFFQNFFSSIFRTYVMTTGELNTGDDTGFDVAGFGSYLLFLLFAMSMCLVIVNFWTGVAVTDIERIEKNSEINASKNVIIFMLFIDYIYTLKCISVIRNFIPNPLLFLKIGENGDVLHNPEKCQVDFYVNKQRQFEEKGIFPNRLDKECFNKIKSHYHKSINSSNEQVVLTKLEELTNVVNEIKSKYMQNNNYKTDGGSFEGKSRKNHKKKTNDK